MRNRPDETGILAAEIAAVLRDHAWTDRSEEREIAFFHSDPEPENSCRCGWEIVDEDEFDHEAHVAASLVAALEVERLAGECGRHHRFATSWRSSKTPAGVVS